MKKPSILFPILSFFVFSIPLSAWGHEGHGVPGQGETVAHYLFDPVHLPLALFLATLAIAAFTCLRGRRFQPKAVSAFRGEPCRADADRL